MPEFAKLTPDDTRTLVYRICSTEQQKFLETQRQLDFSYSIPGLARFRVNAYFQRTSVGAAFRLIPQTIKSLEQLGMPPRLYDLSDKPRGLILVTGPTGSGKSTTLASLLDRINETRHEHILTIEDPIEFLHWHRSCIVNQREIGPDATSFADALRSALRQDPDVILVGEMRDLETIGDRPHRRRDRPPRLRDAAHPERAADDRPDHRRLPRRAAGSGARPARRHAAGNHHPEPRPDRRRQPAEPRRSRS